MNNIVIKILVVVLGISAYFNVSMYFDQKQIDNQIELLNQQIEQLEELNDLLIDNQIDPDACLKINEIVITVVNEEEDVNVSVTHCTNELLLGDVLDELQEDMEIVYDPNYSRDYIYGRLVHSFYGMSKEYEDYYAITVDGVYATTGIDFIEISSGSEYTFTLTRWG